MPIYSRIWVSFSKKMEQKELNTTVMLVYSSSKGHKKILVMETCKLLRKSIIKRKNAILSLVKTFKVIQPIFNCTESKL